MATAYDYANLGPFKVIMNGVDVSSLVVGLEMGASMFDTAVPGVYGELLIRDATGLAGAVKDALYNAGVPITISYSDTVPSFTHSFNMVSAGLVEGSKSHNNRYMGHRLMMSLQSFLDAGQNVSLASMGETADSVIKKLFSQWEKSIPLETVVGKVLAEKEHFLISAKPVMDAIQMVMNRMVTADQHTSNALMLYASMGNGVKFVLDSIPGLLEKATKGSPTIYIGGQGRTQPLTDPRSPFTCPTSMYQLTHNSPSYRSAAMQYGGGSAEDAVFNHAEAKYTPGMAKKYDTAAAPGSPLTTETAPPSKQHRVNYGVFDPRLSEKDFAEAYTGKANRDELAMAGSPHHTVTIPSITNQFYLGGSCIISNPAAAVQNPGDPGFDATAGHCVITEITHRVFPIKKSGPKVITSLGAVQTSNQGVS